MTEPVRSWPTCRDAVDLHYKAEIIAQYRQMEFDGLVENADAMAKAAIVERNARDPSWLDVLWAPDWSVACASSRRSINSALLSARANLPAVALRIDTAGAMPFDRSPYSREENP